ncbi:putattive exported protein [Bordetella ansorpii]|uniref:Putattive exported protein n=1 Tax=Bordetella ansorpii TaxID=288768 RepID=A0A157LSP8_9BORD|nr:tripartite tricarboxylate transporter substrate binding protein [Bordetella ansorpii]SAH99708.1 putattive exported protein [Bordetella ansorpii]
MKQSFKRHGLAAALCLAAVLPGARVAQAADTASWPSRPVQLIVPFANGGSTDLVARKVADALGKEVGQTVIVENKVGAGGVIGSSYLSRQKPDGYALLLGTVSTHSIHESVMKNLPYNPRKDFTPITMIGLIPDLIVVNPEVVKVKNLQEFIALAKAKPGVLNYASGGPGTSSHLGSEYFATEAQIKMNHVPYKGSGPALIDVLGGHVDMMLDVIMTSLEPVKAGRLKALGVTSRTRSPLLPDVPTLEEQGMKDFEAIIWFAVYAPPNMPADLQEKIAGKIDTVLKRPEMVQFLQGQGIQVVAEGPKQLQEQANADADKWRAVVQKAGIEPQ